MYTLLSIENTSERLLRYTKAEMRNLHEENIVKKIKWLFTFTTAGDKVFVDSSKTTMYGKMTLRNTLKLTH